MVDDTSQEDTYSSGCGCSKANELVFEYIDGLLDETMRMSVQEHINGCPDCKHGYEFENAFHMRIRNLKPVCMPEEVKGQIMLALGFPGMSAPVAGSLSPLGSPDVTLHGEIASQMGIPKGEIPKGTIPGSQFFSQSEDLSSPEAGQED